MFQFPGLPPTGLCVHPGVARLTTVRGSPIRRSSAPSPRAAPRGISLLRHVLLRHERPRHPPDALRHGHTGAGSPPSPLPRDPLPSSIINRTHAGPLEPACALLLLVRSPRLSRCPMRHFLAADEDDTTPTKSCQHYPRDVSVKHRPSERGRAPHNPGRAVGDSGAWPMSNGEKHCRV